MAVEDDEQYFPRGGTPARIKKKKTYVFDENKEAKEPKKKIGKRERKKLKLGKLMRAGKGDEQSPEEPEDLYADVSASLEEVAEETVLRKVRPLGYESLTEGLVTLCSISSIQTRSIQLSLPERLLCSVGLSDISTPLMKTTDTGSKVEPSHVYLRKIFRVGDVIACKIKSVKRNGPSFDVVGTTDPVDVNSSLNFTEIHVGSTFLGAVKSIEDHGYIIFSGIKNLTVFLPFEKAASYLASRGKQKKLVIGALLWCKVVDSSFKDTAKAVQVSLNPEDFATSPDAISEDMINPGLELGLRVTKHLGPNLEVSVDGTDIVSVIPYTQYRAIEDDIYRYKIGSKLRGTVIYKYPISNLFVCSLRIKLHSATNKILGSGEIIQRAEIVSHDKRGLGVKFEHKGRKCGGIISKRRMESNVTTERLAELFPKGNHLTVVIIGYHHVDQLYSCSTQNDLVSGKLITMDKLKEMVGQEVTVVVKSIKHNGAVVMLENRTAFVPIYEITDTRVAEPLKKLQVNSKQKGRIRVINTERNSVIVTLRPTLVDNKPLTDFSKAVKGEAYYGSISSISNDRIIVSFFNDLKAPIPQDNLIQEVKKYKTGQLVKCYVVKEENGKKQPPKFSLVKNVDQMELSIGLTYKLIIKGKTSSGIICLLQERDNIWNVDIPLNHLSDHKSIQKKRLHAFSPGTTVDGHLFCFDSDLKPVFTLRNSVKKFFEQGGQKLLAQGCAALKPTTVIPVILAEETSDGYYICVPVPKFNGKALLAKEVVQQYGNVSEGDVLWLSVERVNVESRRLQLECMTFENHYKYLKKWAIAYLDSYLNEMAQFQTYQAGEKVSAVATEIKNQCTLPDNRIGLICHNHAVKPGSSLNLMVLDDKSEVTLCEVPLERKESAGLKEMSVIFSNEMYVVCKTSDGMICFCPRYLRPNATEPDVQSDTISSEESFKIQVEPRTGKTLFGTFPRNELNQSGAASKSEPNVDANVSEPSPSENPKNRKKRSRSLSAVSVPAVHKKLPKTTLVTAGVPYAPSPITMKNSAKKMKRKSFGNPATPAKMKANSKRPRKTSL